MEVHKFQTELLPSLINLSAMSAFHGAISTLRRRPISIFISSHNKRRNFQDRAGNDQLCVPDGNVIRRITQAKATSECQFVLLQRRITVIMQHFPEPKMMSPRNKFDCLIHELRLCQRCVLSNYFNHGCTSNSSAAVYFSTGAG